jgi:xanthine dehydrogenase accessory factor
MYDTAQIVRDWLDSGQRVAFARVVNRVGFSGDTELEMLACNERGETSGDLLGGTVTDASLAALRKALAAPATIELLSAHVNDDRAVSAGLSCGGSAQVLVQPADAVPSELWPALAERRPVVLATGIDGRVAGTGSIVVLPDQQPSGSLGDAEADQAVAEQAVKLLAGGLASSDVMRTDAGAVLVEAFIPEPHVVVVGGGALAEAISAQARLLGWLARVATDLAETEAALEWAGQAGAMVVLSHDVDLGPDALYAALHSDAFFVGALGSRRTQANRATRLTKLGVGPDELARIHGPVGLDLGGRSPAQIALAICAEVLAVRTGRQAAQLRATEGSIRNRSSDAVSA